MRFTMTLNLKNIFQKLTPDQLGEFLRAVFFVEPVGAVTCFETVDETQTCPIVCLPPESICRQTYNSIPLGEDGDFQSDIQTLYLILPHVGQVIVGWFWDGDGVLEFYIPSLGLLLTNDDCKKDHGWVATTVRSIK